MMRTQSGKRIPSLDSAEYTTQHRWPKWSRTITVADEPRLMRREFSGWTAQDHRDAAQTHANLSNAIAIDHGRIYDAAAKRYGEFGPQISGIGRAERFPERVKNQLRDEARHASQHRSLAQAHWRASGARSVPRFASDPKSGWTYSRGNPKKGSKMKTKKKAKPFSAKRLAKNQKRRLSRKNPHPINEKLGTELHPDDRRHALAAYVHRTTNPGYTTDARWLAHTRFVVKANGRLDRRNRDSYTNYSRSNPTHKVETTKAGRRLRPSAGTVRQSAKLLNARKQALAAGVKPPTRSGDLDYRAAEWKLQMARKKAAAKRRRAAAKPRAPRARTAKPKGRFDTLGGRLRKTGSLVDWFY